MIKKSFQEISFPSDIAYGATGGPEFFTDVVASSSGFEQRNINWAYPRSRYNLASAIKTKEQLDVILSFFRLSYGRAIGFRFKDWSDYQIKRQKIAIADGVAKEFQLTKTYKYFEYFSIRKITKPIVSTIKVYLNENLVKPEVNSVNGIVRFEQPPIEGSIISIEGEFEVPVRFDSDHLSTSIESYNVYTYHEIPLVEIKL